MYVSNTLTIENSDIYCTSTYWRSYVDWLDNYPLDSLETDRKMNNGTDGYVSKKRNLPPVVKQQLAELKKQLPKSPPKRVEKLTDRLESR